MRLVGVILFKLGNKKLFVLLFSFIIFIALMGLTLDDRVNTTWTEKFVVDTVSWMQGLFYKPAGYVAGFFEDIKKLDKIYEENKVLKRTLSQYARDRAKLNTLEYENERLTEALEFTEKQKGLNDYTFRIAQVVSYSTDPYNHTLRINLGLQDNIQENMAVATTEGLIGRIMRVTEFHSIVQLISNIDEQTTSTKAIAATVQGKEHISYGIIEDYDQQDGLLFMTKIKQDDPLEVGDIVVTSGLGQVFPKGVVIGTVVSRDVGEYGITHTAKIKPTAQLANIREVFVIEVPEM
jgi:rod shape-determining protein MreC